MNSQEAYILENIGEIELEGSHVGEGYLDGGLVGSDKSIYDQLA